MLREHHVSPRTKASLPEAAAAAQLFGHVEALEVHGFPQPNKGDREGRLSSELRVPTLFEVASWMFRVPF